MDGSKQLVWEYVVIVFVLVMVGTVIAVYQENKALLGVSYTFLFASLVAYYLCND